MKYFYILLFLSCVSTQFTNSMSMQPNIAQKIDELISLLKLQLQTALPPSTNEYIHPDAQKISDNISPIEIKEQLQNQLPNANPSDINKLTIDVQNKLIDQQTSDEAIKKQSQQALVDKGVNDVISLINQQKQINDQQIVQQTEDKNEVTLSDLQQQQLDLQKQQQDLLVQQQNDLQSEEAKKEQQNQALIKVFQDQLQTIKNQTNITQNNQSQKQQEQAQPQTISSELPKEEVQVTPQIVQTEVPKDEVQVQPQTIQPEIPNVQEQVQPLTVTPEIPKEEVQVTPQIVQTEVPKEEVQVQPQTIQPEIPNIQEQVQPLTVTPEIPKEEVQVTPQIVQTEIPKEEVQVQPQTIQPEISQVQEQVQPLTVTPEIPIEVVKVQQQPEILGQPQQVQQIEVLFFLQTQQQVPQVAQQQNQEINILQDKPNQSIPNQSQIQIPNRQPNAARDVLVQNTKKLIDQQIKSLLAQINQFVNPNEDPYTKEELLQ